MQIIAASPDHIPELARNMRQADIDELWAGAAILPAEGLRQSIDRAEIALSWFVSGEIAAMGGVGAGGVVWLLGTDLIDTHRRAFLRESSRLLERARRCYPVLYNHVDARHTKALRWLRWLEFEVSEPAPWGVFRRPFCYFEWGRG